MNINIKSIIIDIVILHVLVFIGGVISGAAAGSFPSLGSLLFRKYLNANPWFLHFWM